MEIEAYLKEMFAYSKFDEDSGLSDITSSVLKKYGLAEDEDEMLFDDELGMINAAAGYYPFMDEDTDGMDGDIHK